MFLSVVIASSLLLALEAKYTLQDDYKPPSVQAMEGDYFHPFIRSKFLEKAENLDKWSQSFDEAITSKLVPKGRLRRGIEDNSISLSSEEIEINFHKLIKESIKTGWDADKKGMLLSFIEDLMSEETNVTLIAWQITDERNVNSIELQIPPMDPETARQQKERDSHEDESSSDESDEDDDSWIPYRKFNNMKNTLRGMEAFNIPMAITVEEFQRDGERELAFYLDSDEMFLRYEDMVIYNRTVNDVTMGDAVKMFEDWKRLNSLPNLAAIGQKNPTGMAYMDVRNPLMIASVKEQENASDEMMVKAPVLFAEALATMTKKSEISGLLAERFNGNFADYRWNVLVDPENYHLTTKNVSLYLTYDNMDLFEGDIGYMVYGVHK